MNFISKKLNSPEQIHNSSLIRYGRFEYLQKNNTNKKCILISFKYRPYSNTIFEKLQYKNNVNLLHILCKLYDINYITSRIKKKFFIFKNILYYIYFVMILLIFDEIHIWNQLNKE